MATLCGQGLPKFWTLQQFIFEEKDFISTSPASLVAPLHSAGHSGQPIPIFLIKRKLVFSLSIEFALFKELNR
jgi:hypothetical protein